MKFRCIYCAHTFDCAERPAACPSCATSFTLTVTPDTPIFDLAMALDRNGRELDFTLRARLPEQHPEHMDVALAVAPEHPPDARAVPQESLGSSRVLAATSLAEAMWLLAIEDTERGPKCPI